jgi:hypothetical protein
MPLPPLLLVELVEPALPRDPADTVPALRLAVVDVVDLATDEMLLPADAVLTAPALEAALAVAALARELTSAADLFDAATPPPVPAAWPETDVRAACSALLRDSVCCEATVAGAEPDGRGPGE